MTSRQARRLLYVFLTFVVCSPMQAHVGLKTRLTAEVYNPGDQIKIEWEVLVEHDPVDWDLFYSEDGGISWEPLEEGLPLYQLEYTWTAPDFESSKMLLRIVQDNEVTEDYVDQSDTFSILPAQATAVRVFNLPTFAVSVSPNPVRSDLRATLVLSEASRVSLNIYNFTGQLIKEIEQAKLGLGTYTFKVETTDLPSGILFVQSRVNGIVQTDRFCKLE